jgi:hypothetical protein
MRETGNDPAIRLAPTALSRRKLLEPLRAGNFNPLCIAAGGVSTLHRLNIGAKTEQKKTDRSY